MSSENLSLVALACDAEDVKTEGQGFKASLGYMRRRNPRQEDCFRFKSNLEDKVRSKPVWLESETFGRVRGGQ